VLTFFIPEKKEPELPPGPEDDEFDAFAGGYPVPPITEPPTRSAR
jgi:NADH-quinone oxidoreductase subunit H